MLISFFFIFFLLSFLLFFLLISFFVMIIISTSLTVPTQPSPRFHVEAWLPFRNCEMDYIRIYSREDSLIAWRSIWKHRSDPYLTANWQRRHRFKWCLGCLQRISVYLTDAIIADIVEHFSQVPRLLRCIPLSLYKVQKWKLKNEHQLKRVSKNGDSSRQNREI